MLEARVYSGDCRFMFVPFHELRFGDVFSLMSCEYRLPRNNSAQAEFVDVAQMWQIWCENVATASVEFQKIPGKFHIF